MGKGNRDSQSSHVESFLDREESARRKRRSEYVYERIERSIRTRRRGDGRGDTVFEVQVWADGRASSRTFQTVTEARAFRDRQLGSRAMGEKVTSADPRVRLDTFVEREWLPWLAQEVVMGNLRESTAVWYRHGANSVLKDLGRFRVSDIERQLLRGFVAKRVESGDSRAKLHQARTTLRSVLALAVEQGVVVTDPSVFLVGRNAPKAVKQPKSSVKAWGREEARKFLQAIEGDDLEVLWHLYLSTGLRRGEAIGLQWDDIDLSAGVVTVRRSLSNVGNQPVFQEPKTESAKRAIAVGESTVVRLRQHRSDQAAVRLAAAEWRNDRDLVFTTADGRPVRPEAVTRRLKRIVQRAGLEWIGVHGLRHTMASLALQAGTDIATVSQRLGHANTQITARVYLHGSTESDRAAAFALEDLLNGRSRI